MTRTAPTQHAAPDERSVPTVAERFALFAECLVVGVLVTLTLPGVLTILPAWAAGCTHIRAHLDGESTALRKLLTDFAAACRHSLPVSLLLAAAFALLVVDLAIVRLGLPGGLLVAGVCAASAVALTVVSMRAAATWTPGARWTELVRQAALRAVRDLRGSLLLVLTLVMLLIATWQLLPLLVPMVGCAVMATVAVERRDSRNLDNDPSRP